MMKGLALIVLYHLTIVLRELVFDAVHALGIDPVHDATTVGTCACRCCSSVIVVIAVVVVGTWENGVLIVI